MRDATDPFFRLKESIGSLMFLWCRLDDALSAALQGRSGAARGKVGGSFHDRLVRLRSVVDRELVAEPTRAGEIADFLARLDAARRQRNLIVHSLSGFCADPKKGEPHLACVTDQGTVRITQSALTALLEEMDRCRRQLEHFGARSVFGGDDPSR